MKILHVITTINLGGAENHLAQLITGQVKKGLHVCVAYLKGDGYWKNYFESINVAVHSLEMKHNLDIVKSNNLKKIIESFSPDLIHAHMPPAELITRMSLCLIKNQTPLIISKHNDERFAPIPFQKNLARWCSARSSHVIAISDAVRSFMLEERQVLGNEKISTVRYGIDYKVYEKIGDEQIDKFYQEFDLKRDIFLFGTVARLVPQKSLDTLLRAFSTLDRNGQVKLLIVGDGELKTSLKKLAKDLRIEENVIFASKRPDIPVVMKALDAFVLPSQYEGFGLVLLEAMAAQTIIIASKVSAIPEIILDKETGFLFPSKDVESLANIMKDVLENPKVDIASRGFKRLKEHFSQESMVESTIKIYKSVL